MCLNFKTCVLVYYTAALLPSTIYDYEEFFNSRKYGLLIVCLTTSLSILFVFKNEYTSLFQAIIYGWGQRVVYYITQYSLI